MLYNIDVLENMVSQNIFFCDPQDDVTLPRTIFSHQ